ncbi:MAG: LD-carboxypeptidase [Bacteroidales bacterium]|jgi:muramoyltetrapeptide carboxypeptidase|nr:LD-carboxypeptidase [Bacteroidales bacterium]
MELLHKKDIIRIVAPARKISQEELALSVDMLERNGYRVEYGKNMLGQYHQFSGTDSERIADIQEALDSDDVRVIWFARGGYGSIRLIDHLDFSKFIKNPKWLCGYSDMTVFHACVNIVLNRPSLHATMPVNLQGEDMEITSFQSMLKALKTGKASYSIAPHPLNREGKARGKLCGGNLSVLCSMSGSVTELQTLDKILFIEDTDEYLYHIDRMMMCLKRAGKLDRLAALIVGGMSKIHDNSIAYGKSVEAIIKEHVSEYNYPVCFGFPAGHIPDNRALIMGGNARLDVSNGSVTLQMTLP